MIPTVNIPNYVSQVLNMLEINGFSAYLVGGCVRDSFLGKSPSDWDITTDAAPHQIIELFPHTIPTGLRHGTVTVVCPEKQQIEITTFRIDGEYKDGRRPETVLYSDNLLDDLSRRDFTINAMAWSPVSGLTDPFHGKEDLEQRLLRCVGQAETRFAEDALRMLRAIRFSAVLGLRLHPDIPDSIIKLHSLLTQISIERIQTEFTKTLLSQEPQMLFLYKTLQLIPHILPELAELPDLELKQRTAQLQNLPKTIPSRFAFLFSHTTPQLGRNAAKRLRFDNLTCKKVYSIMACLQEPLPQTAWEIRSILADKSLQSGLLDSFLLRKVIHADQTSMLTNIDHALSEYQQIQERQDCISLGQLALNGTDLDALGIPDGKQKGTILQLLLKIVLMDPDKNTKEILSDIVKEIR